ncbi:hypothetical protein [Catenulispora pinisilvae]|uniref:hypothetical protein n=1 Tax=Catenulispora pinisilvae TaxID=2705253 RepID=UPI0018921429|nr:hypothetical protein [Catenulispora pinisilvae]
MPLEDYEKQEKAFLRDRSLIQMHYLPESADYPRHGIILAVKMPLRRIAETYARCFKRESHYDSLQFEADEPSCQAALLTTRRFAARGSIVAGAAGFSSQYWADQGDRLVMAWVWIHPYERGQGLLWQHWAELEREYGQFLVAHPYSPAMIRFLIAHRDSIDPERITASYRTEIYGTDGSN